MRNPGERLVTPQPTCIMSRMSSCRGHEFAPVFGALAGYESSSSGSGDEAEGQEREIAPRSPGVVIYGDRSPKSEVEASDSEGAGSVEEDLDGAFAEAKDRWKIDAETAENE